MARKIVEMAMSCTTMTSEQRMTMSNVVMKLKQCLDVNESHGVFEDIESPMQNFNDTFHIGSGTLSATLTR